MMMPKYAQSAEVVILDNSGHDWILGLKEQRLSDTPSYTSRSIRLRRSNQHEHLTQ